MRPGAVALSLAILVTPGLALGQSSAAPATTPPPAAPATTPPSAAPATTPPSAAPATTPPSAAPAAGPGYYEPPVGVPFNGLPEGSRQGFYIGFALGAGGLRFKVDGETGDRENSVAITLLRLGVALTPQLLIGGNIGGWSKSYDDAVSRDSSVTMIRVSGEVTFYPILSEFVDVFVRGGVGGSSLSVELNRAETFTENGGAFHAGLGVEKKLSASFALGVGLDWHFATLTDNVTADYWELAAQAVWY